MHDGAYKINLRLLNSCLQNAVVTFMTGVKMAVKIIYDVT